MSNKSTFMSEIEAKRIYSRHMRKLAWCIQIISFAVLLLTTYIANNSESLNMVGFVVAMIVSIAGLITGYIIQLRFSMNNEVR